MITLPVQLQDKRFRFIKTRNKSAIEKGWQKTQNYMYNEPEFEKWLASDGDYGIILSYGGLIVIDADIPEVDEICTRDLPVTYTQKSGRGKHFFYFVPELKTQIKLKMIHDKQDSGDIKAGNNRYIMGAGSKHPSGFIYSVLVDAPIAKIELEQITFALRDFIETEGVQEIKDIEIKNFGTDLPITKLVDMTQLKKVGNEYVGSHPVHGSNTKKNFAINPEKNTWYCFRHQKGGGFYQLIAILENFTQCGSASRETIRRHFNEIKKVASEKYGLEISEDIERNPLNFFDGESFVPNRLADYILQYNHFKTTEDDKDIYIYKDGVYRPYGDMDIGQMVIDILGDLAKSTHVAEVISNIKYRMKTENEEQLPPDIINLKNGLFHLRKRELMPHDWRIFTTKQFPIAYDPEAQCDSFNKFMQEILPLDSIVTMQEFFGYCLYRKYNIANFFLLVGGGANGKSTMLNVLTSLLGSDNVSHLSLQEIESDKFSRGELLGKYANIYDDLSPTALRDTGNIKMLTGGGEVHGEKKYKNPKKFWNTAKMIFSTNRVPKTQDISDAFFRRVIFVNFPRTFSIEERNENLIEDLTTPPELAGVFNWALDGLERLLKQGKFSFAKTADDVREEYIRLADPIHAFFDDECIKTDNDNDFIDKEVLYSRFVDYCNEKKLSRVGDKVFATQVKREYGLVTISKRVGLTREGKRNRVWSGVRFKTDVEKQDETE